MSAMARTLPSSSVMANTPACLVDDDSSELLLPRARVAEKFTSVHATLPLAELEVDADDEDADDEDADDDDVDFDDALKW